MSELGPNPDVYKRFAQGRVDTGDQAEIRSTTGGINELIEGKQRDNYIYDEMTHKDEGVAFDAAHALKPDIDAIADARSRKQAVHSGQSSEDLASLTLLEKGAELDLVRNTEHAVKAAKMLGHLANRNNQHN